MSFFLIINFIYQSLYTIIYPSFYLFKKLSLSHCLSDLFTDPRKEEFSFFS